MPHQQPTVRLELGEYELQALETITQHAIDQGALSPELFQVVAGIQQKVTEGRSKLVMARRRIAMENARGGTHPRATAVPVKKSGDGS